MWIYDIILGTLKTLGFMIYMLIYFAVGGSVKVTHDDGTIETFSAWQECTPIDKFPQNVLNSFSQVYRGQSA